MLGLDSPVGWVTLRGERALESVRISAESEEGRPQSHTELERVAAAQLEEYFSGSRTTFDVPIASTGTELQQDVWRFLDTIPYGQSVSYGHIARELGLPPAAARAVGSAVGANPVLIVRPCHRVLGADGSLTGFAGGIDAKLWLLQLEGVML
ncbi:MAG TPA: methylated-DNA--[protein]-cysteine S-methyltransferase [Microbacteriaceae bacterium]|nr:methylated-DNA--[protein]-cysteine S-methyltransferase [Microbacteriaceae bacterium]